MREEKPKGGKRRQRMRQAKDETEKNEREEERHRSRQKAETHVGKARRKRATKQGEESKTFSGCDDNIVGAEQASPSPSPRRENGATKAQKLAKLAKSQKLRKTKDKHKAKVATILCGANALRSLANERRK